MNLFDKWIFFLLMTNSKSVIIISGVKYAKILEKNLIVNLYIGCFKKA